MHRVNSGISEPVSFGHTLMLTPSPRTGILDPMRLSALVALFVCGCFAPSTPTGAPCDVDQHCPRDQRCVAGTCEREGGAGGLDSGKGDDPNPTPDGPPDDVDADTIKNVVDNCPTMANQDQHDEDGDSIGDVCDNCPHVANANQANTMDTDAVGDVCDPHPTVAGDTIERFLPFHVIPSGVSTPMGNWTIASDTYRNASNFADAELIVGGVRDRVTVEVAGTIEATQGDTWVAIATGENGSPSKFYDCGYVDFVAANNNPADYHNGVIEYYNGTDFNLRAGNHMLNQRASGAFTLRTLVDSTANLVRCMTSDARATANTMDGQATNLQPGTVGVKAYGATFTLRYLIIFGQL